MEERGHVTTTSAVKNVLFFLRFRFFINSPMCCRVWHTPYLFICFQTWLCVCVLTLNSSCGRQTIASLSPPPTDERCEVSALCVRWGWSPPPHSFTLSPAGKQQGGGRERERMKNDIDLRHLIWGRGEKTWSDSFSAGSIVLDAQRKTHKLVSTLQISVWCSLFLFLIY